MATRHVPLPSRTANQARGGATQHGTTGNHNQNFSRSVDFGRSFQQNAPVDISRSADFSRTATHQMSTQQSMRPSSSAGMPSRNLGASNLFAAAVEPASTVMPVKIRTAPTPTKPVVPSTSAPPSPAHRMMPTTNINANAAASAATLVSSTFKLHSMAGLGLMSTSVAGSSITAQQTASRFAVHPTKNMCAYAVGTTIVLWDWNVDKHLFFQGHPDLVVQLKFSVDGRNLLSADSSHLFVWDTVSTFKLVARVALFDQQKHVQALTGKAAQSNSSSPLAFDFNADGTLVALAHHSQLSVWDWTSGLHQLVAAPLTDEEEPVRQVMGVGADGESAWITVQPHVLTFWRFEVDQGLVLESQQTLPKPYGAPSAQQSTSFVSSPSDEFVSCALNPLSGFVLVLCASGKLFVLQPNGAMVTSLSASKSKFTSVAASSTHVMLGTLTGQVQMYKNESLAFDRSVPYQHQLRRRLQLHEVPEQDAIPHAVGVSAILPFAASSRFILVVYGDTSLHVLDLQAAQIIRHQIGHFAPLAQVVPHPHPSLTHVVFTTSADQSIGVWQAHQSSRLSVRFVDLPALSDSAAPDTKRSYLSSNAALTGSSQGSIAALAAEGLPAMATALALHPSGCFVGIGDLHGRVRLFQVSKPPPAHAFAASSTMNRTKAQQQQPAFTPTVSEFTLRAAADFVDGSEVTALAFAGGEGHLMAACQRNGALVVCEVGPPIRLLRTVYQARKNTPAAPAFQTVIFLKGASEWQVDAANTHYLLCVAPDSRGIQLLTFSRLSAHRTEVAVVSEMRLQTSTANANNVASNERVSGVSVHPSENYALVSTNAGRVFVFHLQTGECRGIIKTPAASCGQCVIDPSGLYLAVLASTSGKTSPTSVILPPNSLALTAERAVMSLTSSADAVAASTFDEHAEGQVPKMSLESMVPTALRLAGVSLAANAQQPPNSDTSAASVDSSLHMTAASKYTRVLLYEVGTGKYIDEIAQPLGVSHAAFAGNGQAIFVASLNGSMSMFKLKTELAENVRHVMASMTATPYFWSRFPIYLPKATADAVKAPMDFDEDSGASNDLLGGDSNELVPDAPVDEMPEEEQTRRSQSAFDTQRLNKTATNSFGSRAPRSPSVFRQQTAPQQASQPNRRNLNNSNNFQDEFDEESDPFARSMRSEDFSRSRTGPLFNDNGRAERAAAFLADDDDQFMQPMHQQSQQQFSRIPSGFGGDPYDDQQLREQEYHNENTPNGLQGLYAVGSKAPLRHEDDDNMSQASYRSDHIVPMQRPTKEATLTKPPRGVSVFGSRPPQQFDDNASIGDPSALDDFNDNHSQYEQEEFQVHRPGKSVKQQQPSAQFQPKQIAANRAPVSGAPSRRPAQRYAAEDSDGEDGGLEISAPPVPHTREEAAELMRAAMESDSAPVSHVLEDEFAAQQHYQQPMGRPKTATGKQKAMSPAAIKSPKHHFGGNGGRNEESADMAVSYTVRREIDADADGLDEDDEGQSALGALDDFESRLSRLQPVEEPKKAAPAEEVQPQESAAPVDGAEQPAGDAAPADGAAAAEGQPEAAAEPAADGAPAADAPPAEAPADAPPAEEAAPAAE